MAIHPDRKDQILTARADRRRGPPTARLKTANQNAVKRVPISAMNKVCERRNFVAANTTMKAARVDPAEAVALQSADHEHLREAVARGVKKAR